VKYLLDSGIWLWSIYAVDKLTSSCLKILQDGRQDIYFSAASAWELSIKARLGKLNLPGPPAVSIAAFTAKQGLRPLPITQLHAVKTYDLPFHHDDPFDRLIIAQAIAEEMTILTADRAFRKYDVDLVWCGS
jgi:PIN domain nuclease of toxin-antitoxin system